MTDTSRRAAHDRCSELMPESIRERNEGCMTMKEKLTIHKQIVEESKRKLQQWKEGRKRG